jgi:hypothetical protein
MMRDAVSMSAWVIRVDIAMSAALFAIHNIGHPHDLDGVGQFFWARRRDELIDKNAIFTGG